MNEGYFARSFRAIRSTPHWMSKLCLLSLIMLIPIFGPMVVLGYATGWARDAAWGVEESMPQRIFANEDSHLYSRGFFALVIDIIYSIIPVVLGVAATLLFAVCAVSPFIVSDMFHAGHFFAFASVTTNVFIQVFVILISFAVTILSMVGVMRMAIYAKFTAAFNLRQIIVMAQKDARGLLKIFGLFFGGSVALSILTSVVAGLLFVIGLPVFLGLMYGMMHEGFLFAIALVTLAILGLFGFFCVMAVTMLGSVFLIMMTYRCMGYWIAQFDVPRWQGPHDALPFEIEAGHEGR